MIERRENSAEPIAEDNGSVSGPAAVVLEQDACFTHDAIDVKRWTDTVFFPLVMIGERGQTVVETAEAFAQHLAALHETGLGIGMHGLRTTILSTIQPSEDMAIVKSVRHRTGAADEIIGSASITWLLLRSDGRWLISQIHFNATRKDPSVVSQMETISGEHE